MRILLKNHLALFKFMRLESVDRDGSLILVVRRDGTDVSSASWSTKPGEQNPIERVFEKSRDRNKRITIHQSGCVNYHENERKIFIEPLTRVTQAICIYHYYIPAIEKLDFYSDPISEENAVFDVSEYGDKPVLFSICIAPKDFVPPGRAIKLTYNSEGYSVVIVVDDALSFRVPAGYEKHFITLTLDRGLFFEQQMAEDQALISYHQALTYSKDMIMYAPNGEGFIKLIFAVSMLKAPKFKIELADPGLYVSDNDVIRESRSEKTMLKFRVRDQRTKQIIRENVPIKSITLDARL